MRAPASSASSAGGSAPARARARAPARAAAAKSSGSGAGSAAGSGSTSPTCACSAARPSVSRSPLARSPSSSERARPGAARAWRACPRRPPRRARRAPSPGARRPRACPRRRARRPRGSARTCSDVPADSEAAGRAAGGASLSRSISSATPRRCSSTARLLVAAAPDREVVPLDLLSIHGGQDTSPVRAATCWSTAWPTKCVGAVPRRRACRRAAAGPPSGALAVQTASRKRDERRQRGLLRRLAVVGTASWSISQPSSDVAQRARHDLQAVRQRPHVDPHHARAGSAAARGRPPRRACGRTARCRRGQRARELAVGGARRGRGRDVEQRAHRAHQQRRRPAAADRRARRARSPAGRRPRRRRSRCVVDDPGDDHGPRLRREARGDGVVDGERHVGGERRRRRRRDRRAGRRCSASTSTAVAARVSVVASTATGSWSSAITGPQPSLRRGDREHAGAAAEVGERAAGLEAEQQLRGTSRVVGCVPAPNAPRGALDRRRRAAPAPPRGAPSGRTTMRPPIGGRRPSGQRGAARVVGDLGLPDAEQRRARRRLQVRARRARRRRRRARAALAGGRARGRPAGRSAAAGRAPRPGRRRGS